MLRRLILLSLISGLLGLITHCFAKGTPAKDPLKRRAFVGLGDTALPDSLRARIAPDSTGLYILAVVSGASADKIGLKKGDVLLRLNGIPMRESNDVRKIVYNYKAGDKVTAEYWHQGKRMTRTTTLTEYPRETASDFDILYDSFKDGDSLRRVIITKPRVSGKLPVIVLLPGVGAFDVDRNRDVYEYPLQNLLYALTRAGFVTVRMDKRGQGDSQGPAYKTLGLKDEVNFFVSGLKALPKWDFMDAQKVILLAHSSGGLHAPLVAAQYPVKGVIALDAVGTGWYSWELARQKREFLLEGLPYDSVETIMAASELAMHKLCIEKLSAEAVEKENPALTKILPDDLKPTYWQDLATVNFPAAWKTVTAPVLVVTGNSDYVVASDESRQIADIVNSFHSGQATYLEIKDLDHDQRTMPSCKASYEQTQHLAWFGPTHPQLAPQVIEWAKKTVGN